MNKLIEIFPSLSASQIEKFKNLPILYEDWNSKINVISRKDINFFYERHLLHSLGIAKVLQFLPNAKILDVGTGGGFPGIPLAILFPQTHFFLIDSIGKKIKVVEEVIAALDLKNISVSKIRAENFNQKVDFVVSRAVTKMNIFVPWVKKNICSTHKHSIKNGVLYLKGGDLTQELLKFPKARQFDLAQHFNDDFFEMKKVVYVPL